MSDYLRLRPGWQPAPVPVASATADRVLNIGEFARRSWLSAKALRLYDRIGLLVPAEVDRHSGYRQYQETQLAEARLIVMLRRLDMSLAQVRDVLAADAIEASRLVAEQWRQLENTVAYQRVLAEHLRIRLANEKGSTVMQRAITTREVAEQLVISRQQSVTVEALSAFIGQAMGELMRHPVAGSPFVVYHGAVNQDSDGPVEVWVPVTAVPDGIPSRDNGSNTGDHPHGDGITSENGESGTNIVSSRTEPAHREAFCRITKAQVAFPQILSAYDAVAGWVQEQGLQIAGSPREVYFTDFMAAGVDDEVCDIAFPIA